MPSTSLWKVTVFVPSSKGYLVIIINGSTNVYHTYIRRWVLMSNSEKFPNYIIRQKTMWLKWQPLCTMKSTDTETQRWVLYFPYINWRWLWSTHLNCNVEKGNVTSPGADSSPPGRENDSDICKCCCGEHCDYIPMPSTLNMQNTLSTAVRQKQWLNFHYYTIVLQFLIWY